MKIAKFQFSFFGINTYVVYDHGEALIIDPGMFNEVERDAMSNFLEREHLVLKGIVNTHLHIDHVIGNPWVKEKYGVEVSAHPNDAPIGKMVEQQAQMFGLAISVENAVIDRPLKDGDEIKVGDGVLKVLHVPGHSPGGIILYDAADRFAIVGDAVFYRSIGRTDLPGGSAQALLAAIREKIFTLPGDTVLYPGHGEPTTVRDEMRENPFFS